MTPKLNIYWKYFQKFSPLLVVALLFLLLNNCENKESGDELFAQNYETLNTAQKDIVIKNKEIQELAHQKRLLIVTEKQLRKQLIVKDDTIALLLKKIKDPEVVIKWKTRVEFDTIFLPFTEPIPYEFNRKFNQHHQWYSISGTVTQFGINLDPPYLPNEQRLVIGYVKGKPTATITNSNPFIVTEDMEGQIIHIPKKRWVLSLGVGYNYFQEVYFGPHFGYKIFEF